jgi:adenine-specific DNA methylase
VVVGPGALPSEALSLAVTVTQSQLDALVSAYARGVLEVEHDGMKFKFTSGRDMRERINWLRRELESPQATVSYVSCSRGDS